MHLVDRSQWYREDLLLAYLQFRQYEKGLEALRRWHMMVYTAFAAAFECQLSDTPGSLLGRPPSWWSPRDLPEPASSFDLPAQEPREQARELCGLFESTVCLWIVAGDPFPSFPEHRPYASVPYEGRYERSIRDALGVVKGRYWDLLLDILGHVWGLSPDAYVNSADLLRHGYDVTRSPFDDGDD